MNQAYGVRRSPSPAPNGDPNGYTFDQDYAGGGPLSPITMGGQSGILLVTTANFMAASARISASVFYSSLGMAISHDNGATFSELGEIIQPYPTRTAILSANQNLDVGGGTMLLADANGAHIPNVASADPATVYLYVFYTDQDPGAASSLPCNIYTCLVLARAKLSDIETAALAGNTAVFPSLFHKYYQGSHLEVAEEARSGLIRRHWMTTGIASVSINAVLVSWRFIADALIDVCWVGMSVRSM